MEKDVLGIPATYVSSRLIRIRPLYISYIRWKNKRINYMYLCMSCSVGPMVCENIYIYISLEWSICNKPTKLIFLWLVFMLRLSSIYNRHLGGPYQHENWLRTQHTTRHLLLAAFRSKRADVSQVSFSIIVTSPYSNSNTSSAKYFFFLVN